MRIFRQLSIVAAIVALQSLASIFFVADAVADVRTQGFDVHIWIELIVACALVAGVLFGAQALHNMILHARQQEETLAIASGALADHVRQRFAQWGLTKGEADVALFALKGCTVADIAQLRGTAEGTVRAQLARVYAKAHVSSQSALISLFFEDLLDIPMRGPDNEPSPQD